MNKPKYSIKAKVKRKFWSGEYYTVYSLIEETEGKQKALDLFAEVYYTLAI